MRRLYVVPSILPRYATVSAKIPAELKERVEELGMNVSRVIRRALEEEVGGES